MKGTMDMTLPNGIRLELGSYLGRGYAECILPSGLPLDIPAFETIRGDRPPFLCPFSVSGLNGETVLKYDFGNRVSLAYLSGTFALSEFTRLLHKLVDPLLDGEDWFLDYRYFCFDPQYIYLDRSAMDIRYLYFPVQGSCASDEDIKELFAGLLERCQIPDGSQLTAALYKCLMRRDFSLCEFRLALEQDGVPAPPQQPPQNSQTPPPVQKKPVQPPVQPPVQQPEPPVKQPAPGGWNFAPAVPPQKSEKSDKSKKKSEALDLGLSSDSDDDLEAILSGGRHAKDASRKKEEKTPLFGKLFGSKPKQVPPVPERREFLGGAAAGAGAPSQTPAPAPAPMPPADDGNTVIDDGSRPESGAFLRYVGNFRNPQTGSCPPALIDIRIHDGAFSIGRFDVSKGYQQSDFEFAADINTVSRFHARIEERNGAYVLIHLGSQAGTYVNGQPLAANVPVPLKNGDRVSFSAKGVDYLFTAQ